MKLRDTHFLVGVGCALLRNCSWGLSANVSGPSASLSQFSCNFDTLSSLRSAWGATDDACHQKLSFEIWTALKAKGPSRDGDAQHVWANCLATKDIGILQLSTREDVDLSEVPGKVVSRTENVATYVGATAATLGALCDDDNIGKVTRVEPTFTPTSNSSSHRRLQSTTSEAAQAHQVAELIAGLETLGCSSTTGEGQTLCIMSNSFDLEENAADLQASGDLPKVEVVKELVPAEQDRFNYWAPVDPDEGKAMIEVAYDIASGATYKFNTAAVGSAAFAEDIVALATKEGCDVIVDGVEYIEPSFIEGPMDAAIAAAVTAGSLHFSSAGNNGKGHRFEADFECDPEMSKFGTDGENLCDKFGPVQVFHPDRSDISRYLWSAEVVHPVNRMTYLVSWDSLGEDIALSFFELKDGEYVWLEGDLQNFQQEFPLEFGEVSFEDEQPTTWPEGYIFIIQLSQTDNPIEADFHLVGLNFGGIKAASDGSMYGHACASSSISVAAIDWADATGSDGEFADPETAPVETDSSRGPCIVGHEIREKPSTCAAGRLSTSTPTHEEFDVTAASATVAAAIATIVRGACFPKVVGYSEMMEILTNYDYTIDYTGDAGGASDTWGADAGHGIISAGKVLAWVEANCAESCPGDTAPVVPCDPTNDNEDCESDQVCCDDRRVCVDRDDQILYDPTACGDPHMSGFLGQKFDFTGEDAAWYSLIADENININMRVTAPVPDVPEITYITGISFRTTDTDGFDHNVIIEVREPHNLESSCPTGVSPCLADGSLSVVVDEEEILLAPGTVAVAPGVEISAVNLPGACRSFGFEKYWERKKLENARAGRRLSTTPASMGEWILGDPTATDMEECTEHVARAEAEERGLFSHQSEHASFQIFTPEATVRLSHGRLHQIAMRDPTDKYDLPDHLTWQMNIAVNHNEISRGAKGILGETFVATRDANGNPIVTGMEAIRGKQEDYRVEGPLGMEFVQDGRFI